MTARIPAASLLDRKPIWLLAVTWNGQTYRWASDALDLASAAGTMHHNGGLEVDLEHTFDLLSSAPAIVSVAFALLFPVSVAERVAEGHDLSTATGELALHVEGRTFEQRQVLLRGRVEAPQYGTDEEPVRFSLRSNPFEDRALIPAASARVTVETWPDHDTAATNRYYPIVIGRPGVIATGTGTDDLTTGSPAFLVDTRTLGSGGTGYLLIAGHEVHASEVRVIDLDGVGGEGAAQTLTVEHVTDALGRKVAVVALAEKLLPEDDTDPTVVHIQEGHRYFARWDEGGGLLSKNRSTYITGAGDVMLWLVDQSTVAADLGRFAATVDYLNRYKLAGVIVNPVRPWDFIVSRLVEILPVSVVTGADGLYPVVWRADVTDAQVVAELVDGIDCVVEGPVAYESMEVVNRVRVNYGLRADDNEYRASVAIVGDDTESEDEHTSVYARASRLRYGPAEDDPIESPLIYDRATAQLIAHDRVRLRGFKRRGVGALVTWRFGWLARGDIVRLTSPKYRIARAFGVVRDIRYLDAGLVLQVSLVEDLVRDSRATA